MAQKPNCEPIDNLNSDSSDDSIDNNFPCTEQEAYESLLDISRIQNREIYLENLKNLPVCKGPHIEPSEDPYAHLTNGVDRDKQRVSANQTYHDFLLHKQYEATRERFDEIKKMGVVFPLDKFAGASCSDLPTPRREFGNRDDRGGGENLYDKTVDFLLNDNLSEEIVHAFHEGGLNTCSGAVKKKRYEKVRSICGSESKKPCRGTGGADNTGGGGGGGGGGSSGAAPGNLHQPNIDYLIEDNYYPGLIDDSINRLVDFNKAAFDVYFGAGNPPPDNPLFIPISLIEAFDLRFEKEEAQIRSAVATAHSVPINHSFANLLESLEEGVDKKTVNREEITLANAIEIDLAALITNKPISPLTMAIECLQRAEIMNDSDQSLQAAEEAYRKAPPDLAESAAVYKADTFKTERISKKEITIPVLHYRPIEVVSYMGITKPVIEPPPKCSAKN